MILDDWGIFLLVGWGATCLVAEGIEGRDLFFAERFTEEPSLKTELGGK